MIHPRLPCRKHVDINYYQYNGIRKGSVQRYYALRLASGHSVLVPDAVADRNRSRVVLADGVHASS